MKKRVCIITTSPWVVTSFLQPLLADLSSSSEVTLAVNARDGYPLQLANAGSVIVQHVPIARTISLVKDVHALIQIVMLCSRHRYHVVHSFAPKAGLLGMLAGWLTGVPHRFHTFQGEVWAARTGLMRRFLRAADTLVARLATNILVVGRGEQAFLEANGVLKPGASEVLGNGSITGVDTNRFRPDPNARRILRTRLSLPDNAVIVLYLGRMARDKGVLDLADAFRMMAADARDTYLVFVGPDEDGLAPSIVERAGDFAARVHLFGYTETPEKYIAAADILCLPSYREGFATVILEASACGVAVMASRIYGTQEALVDGQTGFYHRPGDVREIARLLLSLAADPASRARMGAAGRSRVLASFSQERLVGELRRFYARALSTG